MHSFSFGGISLSHFGGRILQAPFHTVAQRNKKFEKIYGQSGDEIIDNESYDNVDFSVKICFLPLLTQSTAKELAYAVIDWLAPRQDGYYIYSDTYNPGYFTKAALTNFDEVVRELPTLLTATLKFNRVPFWYKNSGQTAIVFSDQTMLTNPEVYPSEPIVTLSYSGTSRSIPVNLIIGDGSVQIDMGIGDKSVQTLDGVKKQHYRTENGANVYLSAALPPNIPPGENVVSLSTSAVECTIIPNWRRL